MFHAIIATVLLSLAAAAQPQKDTAAPPGAAKTAGPVRLGDPYPLDVCPVSGNKLGPTAEIVVKLYDAREIRFCCDACPQTFEKDQAASLARIDDLIIKDQLPLYPLQTSLITTKPLPEQPVDFVFGNRLIRVADEAERSTFLADPARHLAALNKAVIKQQLATYPATTCAASGQEFGGPKGDPADVVMAGRLMRLCCKGCEKRLERQPAKYIAQLDKARSEAASTPPAPKPTRGR